MNICENKEKNLVNLETELLLCRVGVELPSIEVRYKHLSVEAECEVVEGKALPTLWNSLKHIFLVSILENIMHFASW